MRRRTRDSPERRSPVPRRPRCLRGAGLCREDHRLGDDAADLLRAAVADLPLRNDFTRTVLSRIRR